MAGTDGATGAGNRREALAALLASSALGLATFGAPSTAAKGNGKRKKKRKHRQNSGNDDNGTNNGNSIGSGNGGAGGGASVNLGGNNVGDTLPSVRMVQTTTIFDGDGVFDAISKCPDGYVPINGGFFSSVVNPVLLTSIPRLDENAWLIEIDGARQGHQITVTAICLAATVVVDGEEERSASKSQKARKGSRNK